MRNDSDDASTCAMVTSAVAVACAALGLGFVLCGRKNERYG